MTYSQGGEAYPTPTPHKSERERGKIKVIGLATSCAGIHIIKGRIEELEDKEEDKQLLDGLKEMRGYWKFKEEALNHAVWRTCSRRVYGPVMRQTTE